MQQKNQNPQHVPVMLEEVLTYLAPQIGESFLDLTAGYGGHARAILDRTHGKNCAVLVDRDRSAIKALHQAFGTSGAQIIHQDFLGAARKLKAQGQQFDIILADLGVSSPHLNMASRGFSIMHGGPLDMRMDQTQQVSAATIVNTYKEAELADIIWRLGEEPRANKIARSIVEHRPITTTSQLADIVVRSSRKGWSKIHPATRTFQALRIAVNDELGQIQDVLPILVDLLAPEGRIAVISFHSLEDRLVKQAFMSRSKDDYEANLRLLTKGPVQANATELVFNPRARSAKLRAAVKINNRKGTTHANSGKK